jgi:Catalytic LigB subunit of aromatic ring-opening dioxygenase
MARIVGAIATSHTPTVGFAFEGEKQEDPVWKPIFEAYEPIKAWLAQKNPDALFVIYNDKRVSPQSREHCARQGEGLFTLRPVRARNPG